jgi:hypothetical protein
VQVVFRNDLASFVQDERHQGALKHPAAIVPLRHVETPFDLTAILGSGPSPG